MRRSYPRGCLLSRFQCPGRVFTRRAVTANLVLLVLILVASSVATAARTRSTMMTSRRTSAMVPKGMLMQSSCGFATISWTTFIRNTKSPPFNRIRHSFSVGLLRMASSTSTMDSSTTNNQPGKGFGKSINTPQNEWKVVHTPLIFVPGMKGTHLAFEDDGSNSQSKKKRAWLKLSHLLNFPPRPDGDPTRDLSLPLTYDSCANGEEVDGLNIASKYPRQHRGNLVPDGIVDHIIEFNFGRTQNEDGAISSVLSSGNANAKNYVDLNFLPFYGHTTRLLREMDREYHSRINDGKEESTETFEGLDDDKVDSDISVTTSNSYYDQLSQNANQKEGIFDQIGSFIERSSNFAFSNVTNSAARKQQSHHPLKHCRPTAVFSYDWRRSLPELCSDLHEFCETTFPGQPVQVVAHSLGGLMTFAAMKSHPEKYTPGAVVVGVPFETGEYLT